MRGFALFDIASDAAAMSSDPGNATRSASAQRSGSEDEAAARSPLEHEAWRAADYAWDPRELVRTTPAV